ncbi:restriction endonuclease subunit S [Flavobacterium sp. XS2P12]|uniref:restriction endonuclease subunit S n=1 Tax=Flavobacterium melibiosi TaxID=3398734 RepID=UPI003A87E623
MKLEFLDNLITIISGYAFKSNLFNDIGEGLPLIRVRDVNSKFAGIYYLGEYADNFVINNGDLLIGLDGDFKCIEWKNGKALLNQRVCKIIPKSNLISRDYLLHFLPSALNEIHRNTNFTTVKHLSVKKIKEIKIPLPEKLEDQIRIATILTQAETLIKQRKESIVLLNEFLKSTFLKMFIYNKEAKKWKFTEVKNTVEKHKNAIKAGPFGSSLKKEVYVESGYKIYGQEQVIKDDLSFGNYYIDYNLYKKLESCKIKEGDILISLVGTYGKISLVPKNFEEGIINPRLMKISFDKQVINPIFFKQLFQSEYLLQQLPKLSRGGTMDIINVGIVKQIKIPVPPLNLQNQFASIVEKAEVLKSQFKESLNELENLFSSLSQRAFKGELDLKKLAIEEKDVLIVDNLELPIPIDKIITPQMQEFIKKTNSLSKIVASSPATIKLPANIDKISKQIEQINKMISPFEKLPKIPESLSQAMKTFENIKSISSTLQESKKIESSRIAWEQVNFQQVSNWIKNKYDGFHFNSEMLIRFLSDDHVTFPNYYSSEELKTNPKLSEGDDLKAYIFSALNNENPFIKLDQVFYNARKENIELDLLEEDYELIKDKEKSERSGIYFKIV